MKLNSTTARDFLRKLGVRKQPHDSERRGFLGFLASPSSSSANAGEIGEIKESKVAVGSAVSLTTATAKTVTSVILTAGSWLVHGHVNHTASGATRTVAAGAVHTTTDALPTDGTECAFGTPTTTATFIDGATMVPKEILVPAGSTTEVFLTTSATFSAGTIGAYGSIIAVRNR